MGIEIDSGLEVKIAANLDILSEAEAEQRRRWEDEDRALPVAVRIIGSGVGPASGSLIFSLDGPALGRMWALRRLAVGQANPTTTTTGAAYFFAGSDTFDAGQLNTNQWLAYMATLPAVAYYANEQALLKYPEKLICLITSPVEGDTYIVSGFGLDGKADSAKALTFLR